MEYEQGVAIAEAEARELDRHERVDAEELEWREQVGGRGTQADFFETRICGLSSDNEVSHSVSSSAQVVVSLLRDEFRGLC